MPTDRHSEGIDPSSNIIHTLKEEIGRSQEVLLSRITQLEEKFNAVHEQQAALRWTIETQIVPYMCTMSELRVDVYEQLAAAKAIKLTDQHQTKIHRLRHPLTNGCGRENGLIRILSISRLHFSVEDWGSSHKIRRQILYVAGGKKERDHSFTDHQKMKSKDLQNVVFSKHENGDSLAKICRDLSGIVSYRTIRRWCKSINDTGAISLSKPPGGNRTIRTKGTIQKVKDRLKRKKPVSARKLALELEISERSVRRILKDDLHLKPYKKIVEPLITDEQKAKRVRFANWIRNSFRKEDMMRILFSDEKMFDIDGVYNAQNDRVWAVDRATASLKGAKRKKTQVSTKSHGVAWRVL